MITLTKDEADALANHLEWYIIQEIKDDEDYDNIQYLAALIHVYERCKEESKRKPVKQSYDPLGDTETTTYTSTADIRATIPADDWEQLKRELGVENFCEVKP